jgi:hypothetical protein
MALNFLPNNNFLYKPLGTSAPTISNPTYEPRAIFSINASNQLQGTFWMTKNGQQMTSNLGTLSFVIRDQNGVTIGITESGLTADLHGFYYMTPVLATAIQDLTHYTVEITATADAQLKKGVVAITLGE